MKTCIHLTTLLILLTAASGCAKFKELTRRDYALIRDPFAAKTAAAESEPPVDAQRSTSGFVRIDDTKSETPDPVKADYGTVAQSKTVAPSGTTGFQGIRVRGMGDAISSEIGTAAQPLESAASKVASAADAIPKKAEAAIAGVDKTVQKQMAELSVADSQPPADSGFSEWASSEVEKWKNTQPTAQEKATPLLNRIQQVSKTVEHSAATETETASQFITETQESARPFIATGSAATPVAKREMLKLKPKPATKPMSRPPVGEANPFADLDVKPAPAKPSVAATESQAPVFNDFESDSPTTAKPVKPISQASTQASPNPFAAFDTDPKKQTSTSSPKAQSLDSGFNFDTGWRPTETEAP